MEKELKKIVANHIESINRYENQSNELLNTINFCTRHKFEEEKRIAQIKFNEISLIIYEYKQLANQVLEVINKK